MTTATHLLARLRRLGIRGVARRLRPYRVDERIYELRGAPGELAVPSGLTFARYSAAARSGLPQLDARLTGKTICYAFRAGDTVAHQSWAFYDTLLPARFGFDSSLAVIGECETDPAFRGRGLYPLALQALARDLGRCYILVAPTNEPSIRGIEKAGGALLGRLRGIQLAGLLLAKSRDPR